MAVRESLAKVLSSPSARAVWSLRAELLEGGVAEESRLWSLLSHFHGFLDRLATSRASRDYSNLASKLDISAISGVILENLGERCEPSEKALRLLSGALSEGLMALATRQHVRAWDQELEAIHRDAAWFLYGELWWWTRHVSPDLEPATRRRLLDGLAAPLLAADAPGLHKAVVIGRLFQILTANYIEAELRSA